MQADTYELKKILNFERRYIVPTFQRDYEWTRSGQWELLFDDVMTVVAQLENERRTALALEAPERSRDKNVSPHFLGAIVLDQLSLGAGSLDYRTVIDGQQRLTTIQLLLRGVLDVLMDTGSKRAGEVRRLIFNPDDVAPTPDDRFKLWPRRRDREVWREVMADDHRHSGAATHLYHQARSYFREQVASVIVDDAGNDRSDTLTDALLSLVKIVVIDLDETDDAQVIFEVLNGRQTALSATDLVKNLLFLRAELDDEEQLEQLYEAHWSQFDDEWWKTNIGIGHAARGRRDVLLSSWLTTATGNDVNVGHLYSEVRSYLIDGPHKALDVLPQLGDAATEFRAIYEQPAFLPARLAESYDRIVRLNVTTAFPLLLWLRMNSPLHISSDDQVRSVVAIESWIVRRMIAGWNTRGYGARFVDVLASAQSALRDGRSAANAIESALSNPRNDSFVWPNDAELRQAFYTRALYNSLSQMRIRLILGALDAQMHRDHVKGELPTFDYEKLQIEHLLPQSWRTHWPVDADDDSDRMIEEQARERLKDCIGNLTLVTGDLNMPMSNGPWSDKRVALKDHSNLRLNSALPERETWDHDAIRERAGVLADVACTVWPGPSTNDSGSTD